MKKSDFKEQAYRLGIPIRVREIEIEVQQYHSDFPELFLSQTPPQLLRPELRNGASNGTRPAKENKASEGSYSERQQSQREKTDELLKWFAKRPRTFAEVKAHADLRGLHQLVNFKYLKKTGDLYTRTNKEFVVKKWQLRPPGAQSNAAKAAAKAGKKKSSERYVDQRKAQRERTAAYLAKFDTEEPRTFPSGALGAYVRRNYLKPKGDGYVRTAKEFHVNA